jgi:hypothetical protein
VTRQFTLTIPIWIEFKLNSTALPQLAVVAQLRSIGRQGKSWKGYGVWG